jgi:hypothetical protein
MIARHIPDASVVTTWGKSSYSGSENADCVEFARLDGFVATRDSKNPTGPALVFNPDAWADFVLGAAAGDFGDA